MERCLAYLKKIPNMKHFILASEVTELSGKGRKNIQIIYTPETTIDKTTIKYDRKIVFSCYCNYSIGIMFLRKVDISTKLCEKLGKFLSRSIATDLIDYKENEEFIVWSYENGKKYFRKLTKANIELPLSKRLLIPQFGEGFKQVVEIGLSKEIQDTWTLEEIPEVKKDE